MKNYQKKLESLNTATNKPTRGGTRKGAGAKPKYNEPTTTIAFRVPVSKVERIKQLVKIQLIQYLKK
jgi:hypothetical protein